MLTPQAALHLLRFLPKDNSREGKSAIRRARVTVSRLPSGRQLITSRRGGCHERSSHAAHVPRSPSFNGGFQSAQAGDFEPPGRAADGDSSVNVEYLCLRLAAKVSANF